MDKNRDWSIALVFFASGLGAGLLNYLYQVVAGRNLSASEFANLNGWFANLSIFLALGGFLQYVSNFWPAGRGLVRIHLVWINVFALVSAFYWLQDPETLSIGKAVVLFGLTSAFGWLSGQAQVRLAFRAFALSGAVVAASKLAIVLLPIGQPDELDRYSLALSFAYLPAFLILTWYLWSAPETARPKRPSWVAPVALSIATVTFPQFDTLILSHSLPEEPFAVFVRATLFSKALYFIIFLLAQWLLPRQVQGRTSPIPAFAPFLVAGSVAVSVLLTAVSPFISRWILNWSEPPGADIVFFSSLQMSLMAVAFLVLQDLAARGRARSALGILAFLVCEGILQTYLKLNLAPYLYAAIGCQIALVGFFWWESRKGSAGRSS